MIQTCKQCSNEFSLNNGEIKYFESKGFPIPKRCPQCRSINKIKNAIVKVPQEVKVILEPIPEDVSFTHVMDNYDKFDIPPDDEFDTDNWV